MNQHDKETETYKCVLLEEILRRDGVPQGKQHHGTSMTTYLIAEAEDGYRVVFSVSANRAFIRRYLSTSTTPLSHTDHLKE